MKDIITKIQEGKSESIALVEQFETGTNAAYSSLVISDAYRYKKLFFTFNEDGEFVTITAFNKAEDLAELIGTESDMYKEYDSLKVGESIDVKDNDGTITKVFRFA